MSNDTREILKTIFDDNQRPTGDDFASLIDSTLNLSDDGIGRPDQQRGIPLRITAQGDGQNLLDFQAIDGSLRWRLSQQKDGRSGFNFSTQAGSKLFIDHANGNVQLSSGLQLGQGERVDSISDDTELGGQAASSHVIATQRAVKYYVDNALVNPGEPGSLNKELISNYLADKQSSKVINNIQKIDSINQVSSANINELRTGKLVVGNGVPTEAGEIQYSKNRYYGYNGTRKVSLDYGDADVDSHLDKLKGQPKGIASLDAKGLLSPEQLPANAKRIHNVIERDEMLNLQANLGEFCYVEAELTYYVLLQMPASDDKSWKIVSGPGSIHTVFNRQGPNIAAMAGDYHTDQVPEKVGALNKYWTDTRFSNSFNSAFPLAVETYLADHHSQKNISNVNAIDVINSIGAAKNINQIDVINRISNVQNIDSLNQIGIINHIGEVKGIDKAMVTDLTASKFTVGSVATTIAGGIRYNNGRFYGRNASGEVYLDYGNADAISALQNTSPTFNEVTVNKVKLNGIIATTGETQGIVIDKGNMRTGILKLSGMQMAFVGNSDSAIRLVRSANADITVAEGNTYTSLQVWDVKNNTYYPATNETGNLGTSTNRWANLYVKTATIAENATISGNATVSGNASILGGVTISSNATAKKLGIDSTGTPAAKLQVNPKPANTPSTMTFMNDVPLLVSCNEPNTRDNADPDDPKTLLKTVAAFGRSGVGGVTWASYARFDIGNTGTSFRTTLALRLSNGLNVELDNTPIQYVFNGNGYTGFSVEKPKALLDISGGAEFASSITLNNQLAFSQINGGGRRHFLTSVHSATNGLNSIRLYLNSSANAGDSSRPGTGNKPAWEWWDGAAVTHYSILPNSDNAIHIGSSDSRFGTIFAARGTINTSDIKLKRDITTNILGSIVQYAASPVDLIKKIDVIRYKLENDDYDSIGFNARQLYQLRVPGTYAMLPNIKTYIDLETGEESIKGRASDETKLKFDDYIELSDADKERVNFGISTSELVGISFAGIKELEQRIQLIEQTLNITPAAYTPPEQNYQI